MLIVTLCFIAGRLIQYSALPVFILNRYIGSGGRINRALILGGLLFGIDLLLFNFFMPLVFAADIPDLILRSFIDILAVTLGCLSFPSMRNIGEL